MKINILEVAGIMPAILAMRLPMKSGDKSDSFYCGSGFCEECPYYYVDEDYGECCSGDANTNFVIGDRDYKLSKNLILAGSSHRKHLRLIDAWFEIEAPLHFWKQFDTYRVGVDKVSESTMHTFKKHELLPEDFEIDESYLEVDAVANYLDFLERHRKTDDIQDLQSLIPQGYKQKRVVKASYEALRAIYHDRKNHKLEEWQHFCRQIKSLPYHELITMGGSEGKERE